MLIPGVRGGEVALGYEIQDGIGVLTLSGPAYPYLESPLFADPDELSGFLGLDELRGVVLTGSGRHFCGGADRQRLSLDLADPAALSDALSRGKALLETLSMATIPVVAAISGQCLGAGLEIALACHFRIASRGALLGYPESGLGLLPGLGGTVPLRGPGRGVLIELVLSGRSMGAEEALERGIVDGLAPHNEVLKEAFARIAAMTNGRPTSLIRAVMESIHNGYRLPREDALRRETELFLHAAGARYREGPAIWDGPAAGDG
jgi:enoyl-CoA hydratase/carnithine racemase